MDKPCYAKLTHFLSSSELLYTESGVDLNCCIAQRSGGTGAVAPLPHCHPFPFPLLILSG